MDMESIIKEEINSDDEETASGVETAEKYMKEENILDEYVAPLNEEKAFLAGVMKIEYPLDNYEYNNSSEFGKCSPKPKAPESNYETVFTDNMQEKIKDDNQSRSQEIGDGSTLTLSSSSTARQSSKPAYSTQEWPSQKEDQSRQFRLLTSKGVFKVTARVATIPKIDSNEIIEQCVESKFAWSGPGKKFQCDECQKQFPAKTALKKHLWKHTGEKPFKCDTCEKTFPYKNSLKDHQKRHTGEKPFQCKECKKRFLRKNDLKLHQRLHTEEKPFQCNECDKGFVRKYHLELHRRTHTREKPFQCDGCDKRFSRSSDLRIHERIHTGETPYQCDECGRGFKQKTALNVHRMTHTGEKPFQCDKCNRGFSQKNNLKLHRMKHVLQ